MHVQLLVHAFLIFFSGLHWPSLAFVGLCGPVLACVGPLCGSLWVFVGLHWPAWPFIASQYVEKKKKKKHTYVASRALHTLPCPRRPALALIWLALACIGCCSLSMLVVKAVGIWYMQKIVSILLLILNYSNVSQITSIKKRNLPNTPHST